MFKVCKGYLAEESEVFKRLFIELLTKKGASNDKVIIKLEGVDGTIVRLILGCLYYNGLDKWDDMLDEYVDSGESIVKLQKAAKFFELDQIEVYFIN
jgi:hypothetical protein